MNNTINNSTISFHATLKISKLDKNYSRKLHEVAKIFEAKTSDYPKDSMSISSNQFSYKRRSIYLEDESFTGLLNLPKKEIATKLVKLFKFFKKSENTSKEAIKINASLLKKGLRRGYDSYYSQAFGNNHYVDKFKDSVSLLLFYIEKCDFQKFIQGDSILKNAKYLGNRGYRF